MPPEDTPLQWDFLIPRHWSEWTWPIDNLRDLADFWVVSIVATATSGTSTSGFRII